MNVNDLKGLKKELVDIYNREKKTINNDNSNLINEELKHIENEIDKVDSLIEIYSDNNIKFRVMMLERLYMRIMSEMTKKEFDEISIDDEVAIYNNYFPDAWVLSISLEKKQEYLVEAICNNKTLDQICHIADLKKKNNIFSMKWNNGGKYDE
ncbi:MAG: hypothetical protein IKF19_02115 [Bacilli bacterium]|nr:hypothetical protein [Bacilli bacterium]